MKLIALLVMAILSAGCKVQQALSVRETIKNIHTLNGQTVQVGGYLGECGGYDCALYQNKADWEQAARFITAARELKTSPGFELPDFLGIGSGELKCPSPNARSGCFFEADRKAAPFTNGYVLITGRVSDVCRDEQLRWGCTDRGPELEPTAFAKWTPPSEVVP